MGDLPADVEQRRSIEDLAKLIGISVIVPGECSQPSLFDPQRLGVRIDRVARLNDRPHRAVVQTRAAQLARRCTPSFGQAAEVVFQLLEPDAS